MIGRLDITETGPDETPLPDQVRDSWGSSPEARKAQFDAMGRERGFWPRLARTSSKCVVLRPRSGSRRGFADWMKANLPAFAFDSRRNYWTAPLAELTAAFEVLTPNVNLSDGARVEVA